MIQVRLLVKPGAMVQENLVGSESGYGCQTVREQAPIQNLCSRLFGVRIQQSAINHVFITIVI